LIQTLHHLNQSVKPRIIAPQRPQETSFYVFNRVENGRIRWVSYQETQEQEVFDPDDELFGIINLRKEDA
jgi:hypothetical protein